MGHQLGAGFIGVRSLRHVLPGLVFPVPVQGGFHVRLAVLDDDPVQGLPAYQESNGASRRHTDEGRDFEQIELVQVLGQLHGHGEGQGLISRSKGHGRGCDVHDFEWGLGGRPFPLGVECRGGQHKSQKHYQGDGGQTGGDHGDCGLEISHSLSAIYRSLYPPLFPPYKGGRTFRNAQSVLVIS